MKRSTLFHVLVVTTFSVLIICPALARQGTKMDPDAKPMTIEEAAMRIDGSADDFVVFRDSSSEKVSVLYKRRDGDLGLIVPEC